ncbi:MAG: elongation factor Ts [Rickettsiales bacterium]|nr:elongation factor Ts [Rickettsiales bacterium]
MSITASLVNELRTKTGVGLMECKKALVETNGNLDEAIKKLRERGLAKAQKKADRSTKEGRIFICESSDLKSATIIELNCETDFVASNDEFISLGNTIAEKISNSNYTNQDKIESIKIDNKSVNDFLADYVLKLGENISLKNVNKINNAAYLSSYTHMNGKIGVIVEFTGNCEADIAKSIAMQVAATNPTYTKPDEVNNDELENEKEIIRSQSKSEGKPEQIIEKIVMGRIQKYYKEVCLLEQAYIKDDKKVIKEILPKDITIKQFIRFNLS